jgi:hypothetical protein
MRTKLLSQNLYLRDPAQSEAALLVSAASSSAVEGIRHPFKAALAGLKKSARAIKGPVVKRSG